MSLIQFYSMADMRLVMCLYKWPRTFHSYEWSFYGP